MIQLLCWEGYESPRILEPFERRRSTRVLAGTLLSDAGTASDLLAGRAKCDVLNINNAWVDYLTVGGGRFSTEGSQYMFPRSDGILLGGTFDRGVESLEPDQVQTERILRDHRMFFRAMENQRRAVNL